ncbi:MAG TPA: hypothetical protein VJN89_22555 [Candidatus Acidoferrum sp.]|nr:hypothetical protein [Candidatus Acidoferrum sp.]
MPDQPPSDRSKPPAERFKTEMPQIPGVSPNATTDARPADSGSSLKLVIGLIVVLAVVFLGARWALRPRQPDTKSAEQPQIEVPSPAPDPSTLVPHATDNAPVIATVDEMAKPWSSKEFFARNSLTGENMPAVLVRLPSGSPSRATAYWAFSVNAPYGNCRLEYITDLQRLRTDYGFADAKHPMVVNPCSHSVFDPAKTATLPGTGAIVRGAIVQGLDLRPPLAVDIRVRGKDIEAIRAE